MTDPTNPTEPIAATSPPTPPHDVPVAPVSTVRPAPHRRRGLVDVVLVVATIFAIGGVGFAVGRVTVTTTAAATAGRGNGQFQGNGQFPGGANGGPDANGGQLPGGGQGGFGLGGGITISGEVVEITADHLTVKLANGQSVEIALSGTTAYHSQADATAADVTPGSTVQVQVTRAGGAGGPGASPGTGGTTNGGALGSAFDITVVPK